MLAKEVLKRKIDKEERLVRCTEVCVLVLVKREMLVENVEKER